MFACIPTINGCLTLIENGFNIMGYLPANQFPCLHAWSIKGRDYFGKAQLITGLALAALGYLTHYTMCWLAKESYLSIPLQMVCLGLLLANHGAFNIARSYIERAPIPNITLAYDFYGKKFLPALNPKWDIQSHLFCRIKNLLNKIIFITLFPPQWVTN